MPDFILQTSVYSESLGPFPAHAALSRPPTPQHIRDHKPRPQKYTTINLLSVPRNITSHRGSAFATDTSGSLLAREPTDHRLTDARPVGDKGQVICHAVQPINALTTACPPQPCQRIPIVSHRKTRLGRDSYTRRRLLHRTVAARCPFGWQSLIQKS